MLFSKSKEDQLKELVRWGKELKINLPAKLTDAEKIARLDLSFKNLTKIPPYINLLTGLKELNLSYNYLRALPKELGDLKKLRVLDLGYNHFTEIPRCTFNLELLEMLSLEANHIKNLPKEISHLKELLDLNVFANQITEIPEEIGALTKLVRLNMAVNQINRLPETFVKLENIAVLELWLNKFDLIPKVISTLPKLHDFYDSFNIEKLNKTLNHAVFADNVELAEKLIFYGADVNYKLQGFGSQLFTTPLFEAKSIDMIELLLKKGANPHIKRELIKTVLTKDGEEIRPTGKFETFLTMKHQAKIAEYLQKIKIPPQPGGEEEDNSSDIFF